MLKNFVRKGAGALRLSVLSVSSRSSHASLMSNCRFASTIIRMPALSPTMTSGAVAQWLVKPGDSVKDGTIIANIETDKAVLEFEYQGDDAIFGSQIAAVGTAVPVTGPIAILVDSADEVAASAAEAKSLAGEAVAAKSASSAKPEAPKAVASTLSAKPAAAVVSAAPSADISRVPGMPVKASPYARQLAQKLGVDLSTINASLPDGVIVASDVLAAVSEGGAPAASRPSEAAADFEDLRVTAMRQTIATRLTSSKVEVPHYYLTAEVSTSAAQALLDGVNRMLVLDAAGAKPQKLTLTALIIKVAAAACLEVPDVNTHWVDGVLRKYNRVDVSCAVATPTGLVTPIIFNADLKGLGEIGSTLRDLAARARIGKLDRSEFEGGTFTVSNLGGPGSVVKHFTAIINPPQSAILAVGAVQRPRGIVDDAPLGASAHDFMTVTLSCDHRVIDGATGGRWLQAFSKYFHDPVRLLL